MLQTAPQFTLDPSLMKRAQQALEVDGDEVAMSASEFGEATLHSTTRLFQPAGPRPLAWVELNGFVNPVGMDDVIKPNRTYIYDHAELATAIAVMNSRQPIIITTGTVQQAAVATGVMPPPKKPEAVPFSREDMMAVFKQKR